MKKKYLIIVADYYKDIASGLLKSAKDKLPQASIIKVLKVPGVFEIPVTISKNINKYDAFLAKKASYLFIFLDIVTGISKTPGTFKTFIILA